MCVSVFLHLYCWLAKATKLCFLSLGLRDGDGVLNVYCVMCTKNTIFIVFLSFVLSETTGICYDVILCVKICYKFLGPVSQIIRLPFWSRGRAPVRRAECWGFHYSL